MTTSFLWWSILAFGGALLIAAAVAVALALAAAGRPQDK